MNFGEVKTQFSDILNRRDCTTSQRNTFLQQGLERIQRELRIPAMQKAILVTVDAQYADLVIPNDLIELDTITCNTDWEEWQLERKSLQEVLRGRKIISLPRIFTRRAGKWLLSPYPQTGTALRIDYYAEYAGVINDVDTNLITIVCPTLAVYAGLSYAGDHFKDKRRDDWDGRYTQIKGELETQTDEDELSGGAAVSPAFAWPSDD